MFYCGKRDNLLDQTQQAAPGHLSAGDFFCPVAISCLETVADFLGMNVAEMDVTFISFGRSYKWKYFNFIFVSTVDFTPVISPVCLPIFALFIYMCACACICNLR